MNKLDVLDILLRLLAAAIGGVVIGLNRDLHGKSAGVRTFGLVSLGAAAITLVIGEMAGSGADAVSRVVQGILTGIGFLGAGVILHQANHRRVTGLTTAAAIWLTAGIGVACAIGFYAIALTTLCLAMFLLVAGKKIELTAARLLGRPPRQPPGNAPSGDD